MINVSKLIDYSITIYDAVENIKNGKYVMPAFQRQYVWSTAQIEKLWDSILLDYPIATFLFWNINENNVSADTYFCNFLNEVTFDSRKQADSVNYELSGLNLGITDTAILDGQQRLTSLFLSLVGQAYIRPSYARKTTGSTTMMSLLIELNKEKLTVDEEEYNSKKFDIRFTDKIGRVSPTQFEIRKIFEEKFKDATTRKQAIEEIVSNIPSSSKEYAQAILNKLCSKIYVEKLIRYTEIKDMKQEDALEMFVRFNSGGKALKKAEITMSILEAYWPSAKKEFGKVLVNEYSQFGTDFIIRTALMLFGDVIKSNINRKIAEELKNNWTSFKETLDHLTLFLKSMNIEISRFSNSWNVILPIIYLIYYNPNYQDNREAVRAYLMRAILFTYFQSGTTSKLQQMKSNINNFDYEITIDMLNQMNDLRVTDGKIEDIVNVEKNSRVAGEVLHYLSLDWTNKTFKYELDHLHPYSRFENSKPVTISMEEWKRWRSLRNRLANLHLLEGRSNGSKSNMRLVDYYNDMNVTQQQEFVYQGILPPNVSLEFEDFEKFYDSRKKLLTEKIKQLLG